MKRILLMMVVSIGVAGVSHPALAQKSPLAQAAYARAQGHLAASRFAEAATEMETAVRFEPRFALGWYVLASASRRAAHCDRAVAAYRRYMELRPAEPDPHFGSGLCLEAIGDADGARAAFRQYVESDHRPESREFVAIARKHLENLERSPTHSIAAGKTPPNAGNATSVAGSAGGAVVPAVPPSAALVEARQLRDHGETAAAIARYQTVIAANPDGVDAHVELAGILIANRTFKEAADELRTAVRLAPANVPAWYSLGFALRETGQTAEAVAAYRRYISFKPADPDPHYGLALALAALGRNDEALTEFRAYTTLEKRPTERRWVKKARAEIARIESTHAGATPTRPSANTPPPQTGTTPNSPPSAVSPPAPVVPPVSKPRGDKPRSPDAKN